MRQNTTQIAGTCGAHLGRIWHIYMGSLEAHLSVILGHLVEKRPGSAPNRPVRILGDLRYGMSVTALVGTTLSLMLVIGHVSLATSRKMQNLKPFLYASGDPCWFSTRNLGDSRDRTCQSSILTALFFTVLVGHIWVQRHFRSLKGGRNNLGDGNPKATMTCSVPGESKNSPAKCT
ncbi:hypothetical protein BDV93DRAFT_508718 [Ceratobasidium sp. AG-I]|nr:hypothetical protein BDV93DRAFT_508718 [Ceratobasidium sp. AG-I]